MNSLMTTDLQLSIKGDIYHAMVTYSYTPAEASMGAHGEAAHAQLLYAGADEDFEITQAALEIATDVWVTLPSRYHPLIETEVYNHVTGDAE